MLKKPSQIWNNLRIGVRLAAGVAAILMLTLVVGLVGWRTLESQARSQQQANQAIDLVGTLRAARQSEKNYMLRGDPGNVRETLGAIADIRRNARALEKALSEDERGKIAVLLPECNRYQAQFENFVALDRQKKLNLEEMVSQGRLLESLAIGLRDDQKKELQELESLDLSASRERREKREKADDANRMIKLMGEARQQEKNFLLRNDPAYAEHTRSLVKKLISQAETTREHFQDEQNQALAEQIVRSAKRYLQEFNRVVEAVNVDDTALDAMVTLGRAVERLAVQLREDQKQELLRLEDFSFKASRQRRDKREKADTANRIIKLMGEARRQEKNFLLHGDPAYADTTRSLVSATIRQAEVLRLRFQDQQNRKLAGMIIGAAKSYLHGFNDVITAVKQQQAAQEEMVAAARSIEQHAVAVRNSTQKKADQSRKTAVAIILSTMVLALVSGGAAALLLTNSIARPINQLVEVINRLAREDNVDVPLVSRNDEVGQIARALSRFKEAILRRKAKTEAQLIQAEKMAALGDLVAGVAHEINTPVGVAVTGSTHLQDRIIRLQRMFEHGSLRKSDFRDFVNNAASTAATIHVNLKRASGLIKSFKQVAVDQSSQEVRRIRLVDYIDEILISLQPKLKQTPHRVEVSGDRLEVEIVPGALSQIITNLVINSLTHAYDADSPAGLIRIRVRGAGDTVLLEYADNGSGMDRETAAKIYEPFFTTLRTAGGSGLGLSIVFNLVTQTLGGTINCRTGVGQGTSFEIRFPVERKPVTGAER